MPLMALPSPRSIALLAASVAALGLTLWWTTDFELPGGPTWQAATVLGDQSIPLAIDNLIRADGTPLSAEDFRGKLHLLFYGYTLCPDICAPTLAGLVGVSQAIDDPRVRIAFASADPERDTPEVLNHYLAYINAPILGITGTPEDMERFANRLGAFAQQNPAGDSYLVDHSSAIWIIDGNAHIAGVLTAPHDWNDILEDMHRMLTLP